MKDQITAFVRDLCCPSCGSFLDAPRVEPLSGELARKCPDCLEWCGIGLVRKDQHAPTTKVTTTA
jgi:hypothetical protein